MNYSTAILKYPTGRYGIVGSIPVHEATWDSARNNSKVWSTEAEVAAALRSIGITHFQLANCSWADAAVQS